MAITDQEDPHFQLVTDDPFDIERLQNICKQTFTETFGDEDLEKFFAEAYDPYVLKTELNADSSQTYFYNLNVQIAGYLKVTGQMIRQNFFILMLSRFKEFTF